MPDQSPSLSLPFMMPAQAQKHVTFNEALALLDALVQTVVLTRDMVIAPASPTEGECHIVPAGASGIWAGHAGALAVADGAGWRFLAPRPGWRVYLLSDVRGLVWDGTDWVNDAAPLQFLDGVGIGTGYDATNRLAVASAASLLTHDGAGHQLKVNKAGSAETASLLFQTGWSGRAEMGTAGSDAFAIKVSSDGASWNTAITFDPASGLAGGAAVQQSVTDATAGRLMAVGAFGVGAVAPLIGNCGVTDNSIAPGFWRYADGSSGGPSGVTCGTLIHLRRATDGGETQFFMADTPSSFQGRAFIRARTSGAWSAWSALFGSRSLLGPVSQSAGVPTGAVIETGANANGTYTRWADGTQICTAAPTLTYVNSGFMSFNWTFPAAFAGLATTISTLAHVNANAFVPGTGGNTLADVSGITMGAPSTTTVQIQLRKITGGANFASDCTCGVRAMAIGRWF